MLKNKKLQTILKLSAEELRDPHYQGISGQLAFFLFLSLLPLLTLLSKFLGIFSLSLSTVQNWVNINLSEIGIANFNDLMRESSQSKGASSVFLLFLTIWAASKAQFSLTGITDYVNNDNGERGDGFVKRRARSFIMIIIVLVTIVVSLAVLVYGQKLVSFIFGKTVLTILSESAITQLRWIIVLGIYFLTISYVYYLTPSKRVPFRSIIPGSIFSSIGFIVVTYFYKIYIGRSTGNNIVYGSLANIVVLLIWFWFMAWVIFLGIVLNKEWAIASEITGKPEK